jgi:hypothetical protein
MTRSQPQNLNKSSSAWLPEDDGVPEHDVVVVRRAADAGGRVLLQLLEVPHEPLPRRRRHLRPLLPSKPRLRPRYLWPPHAPSARARLLPAGTSFVAKRPADGEEAGAKRVDMKSAGGVT